MSRTRQEIFDLAWNGLKAQGFVRSEEDGSCLYRGWNKRKCAVGHCIPEDRYRLEFEGRSLMRSGSPDHEIRRAAGISTRDMGFAADLQNCHDENPVPDGMEVALRAFATKHRLTLPTSES